MASLRFPLILAGLGCSEEDEDLFRESTRLLYGMARACMGDEIQLYSYRNEYLRQWSTTFAWITPLEEMSYAVTVIWTKKGFHLKPDHIKYGATFRRPRRVRDYIWTDAVPCPEKISQTKAVHLEGTPEYETMELAKDLGLKKFLEERVLSTSEGALRSHLRAIADEYLEHFEPFMLAAILGTGPLVVPGHEDLIEKFKAISLPVVRRIYPQLIAKQLTSVQPMKGPSALIYYLRYKHSRKFTWSWFKMELKKRFEKLRQDTIKSFIRWRQRRPGPSWLVRASDPVETP